MWSLVHYTIGLSIAAAGIALFLTVRRRRGAPAQRRSPLEPHAQGLAVERERAAELLDHDARDERAEIADLVAQHDRRRASTTGLSASERPSTVQVTCSTGPKRIAAIASASRPRATAAGSVSIVSPLPGRHDPLVVRRRERDGVGLDEARLETASLDPRGDTELVEQRRHLLGRLRDHRHEAEAALVELAASLERPREPVDGRERRPQVVAGQRDDAGEALVVGHRVPFYRMTRSGNEVVGDLQASTPEVRIGLTRAGVTGVQKAIRIRHEGREKTFSAEISCTVDLDPAQKGVHMSRFPEIFGEAVDEVVIGEAFLVETLAEHIAAHVVRRQDALRAEVQIRAQYPLERRTPGHRPADAGDRDADRDRRRVADAGPAGRRRRGVRHQRLPVRAGTRPRRGDGTAARGRLRAERDIDRILELVPLATHNQRGRGTLLVGTDENVNAEHLVDIVEHSMSSPIYELLKRPDELFVVEHAHLQPRFVEDSVRYALSATLERYPELADCDFVHSRQVNLETIHRHDVLAERVEHRRRVARRARRRATAGRRADRAPRDWLSAA